ncbi:MAG: hybrid sensor histidine kinase/response regulator [Oscillatoriales cyanobacterium C42_A2020_001]|nr:hybrid sensor histidine kinase/response regulator [Leptolyngbyaceae cyanobacterium C42_A2020_001]
MGIDTVEQSAILLVDDNPTNLGILVKALSDAGYQVRVAQDGESAIAQTTYAKPDLILLDVMMPGIDGFETCRRLKAIATTKDVPVIFMTALSEVFDKIKGFEVGAVDYITKPFEIQEVLVRVQTHLAIQTLQNQLLAQNQQLQAEIRERQKAQEAVQVFLHAVSHDLRNPVTGGLMVLKSLLEEAESGTGAATISHSILQRMIQSHDRQLALINSLLETHSNDLIGISLQREAVNLHQLVEQLAADWQPMLKKDDVTLQNQLSKELPLVYADRNQLCRVYENLIANALKHNPPGLTLTLDANSTQVQSTPSQSAQHSQPSMLRCTVQDSGVGISPEQTADMFELYKRGEHARRTVGLGLGLYLCRQIVAAHGGQIGVESQPGHGSTFWFTLPIFDSSTKLDKL